MAVTDPIADMLTRIRNANVVYREHVDVPDSKIKRALAQILKQEGFIRDYELVEDGKHGMIRLHLKYGPNRERVISGLKRISRPGLRVYAGHDELPRVLGGLGIAVLSTSRGVMTEKQAREIHVGGEVLCYVW
ncbi:30S ribosomal protein S8 [Sulfobacillus thermosulfidooxidans]|uniref:Small ribosomal subunit protein uS8 n=1 Tax=Sulfobacillus thermosulfidooxidans TaxID=28034 RepID=A0A1R0IL19_SULTH|nr:30S ribosomal protein S8 [Sulfobacillus thermosulfidooxidans]OLZ10940.1 30S ribosomal protein S8 [Sulfobacillus thermosulfidooxidans]OLZ14428.1 30S ribosomal protein S8 [Sulfobacillus thermosulfidooxidans]OLZ19171.1 30S ribosomal protein S8 [Sulfobacillus thermosulfidooxidans]PSR28446.1 MAG: 30S ribosomal protein S8 [Sulfobacillus thermosulfidooxidans]